jgi:hypothetical protein
MPNVRPVTAGQLIVKAESSGGNSPVLVFYGQRRIVWNRAARRFVGQRQDRPLASWETVITTADAEHAASWLADAQLPSVQAYSSTDAYAAATGQTGELVEQLRPVLDDERQHHPRLSNADLYDALVDGSEQRPTCPTCGRS